MTIEPEEENSEIPDFSGDNFANDKEILKARKIALEQQKLFDDSISIIREGLKVEESSHKNLKGFSMFKTLRPVVISSFRSITDKSHLLVSVAEYFSSVETPRIRNSGTDAYLFGCLKLKRNFPKTYICKESIREKITDFFLRLETDFREYKKFSKKFYVLTEDKARFEDLIRFGNIDELILFPDMELEIINDYCVYRNSRRPVSPHEAAEFVQLTKALLKVFN